MLIPKRDNGSPDFLPAEGLALVKMDRDDVSSGGIHLPERARGMRSTGKIIALGLGRWCPTSGNRYPVPYVPGALVLVNRQNHLDIPGHDGYILIGYEAILGIIPNVATS